MGFIGPIRLIRLIIRHYERLAGCRREKAVQAKDAPAESSRTAAVDSTRMEMELIEWVGAGVKLDR